MIGAFCNFHVNTEQRETNLVRVEAAVSGEKRCVTTQITAAGETRNDLLFRKKTILSWAPREEQVLEKTSYIVYLHCC